METENREEAKLLQKVVEHCACQRVKAKAKEEPAGGSTKKMKTIVNQTWRTQACVVKMPSKIYENESDRSDSSSAEEIEEDI